MKKRAAVNTIIPGRLYQRGNFLTWPLAQKQRLLGEYRITFVVNLWHKIDSDLSPSVQGRVYLNWLCSPSGVPKDADILVEFTAAMLEAGHVGLIHCEAGRGRSVWLCARVLAALKGISGEEALARARTAVSNSDVKCVLAEDVVSSS